MKALWLDGFGFFGNIDGLVSARKVGLRDSLTHAANLCGGIFQPAIVGWMMDQREETLRAALLSDVHAPAKWRVLGPLSNIPEFYQAFGIKAGQPMWRPENERVQIW